MLLFITILSADTWKHRCLFEHKYEWSLTKENSGIAFNLLTISKLRGSMCVSIHKKDRTQTDTFATEQKLFSVLRPPQRLWGIYHSSRQKKRKEGNFPISQEKDKREKNTKPQLQAITTFWSEHGEMICCPFRGSSGLAQHRHPLLPCVSLWRWLIPSFGGDKRRGG